MDCKIKAGINTSTAEDRGVSSDRESDEMDSPKVFVNQFSDSEDDIDHDQVISAVRNTNSSTPRVLLGQDSFQMNLGDSDFSNYVLNKEQGSFSYLTRSEGDMQDAGNKTGQPDRLSQNETLETVDFKDLLIVIDEQCPSMCSSCSDYSETDSEDECSFSDDDVLESWKTTSQPSKKHKNVIPVRNTPHIDDKTRMKRNNTRSTNTRLKERVSSGQPILGSRQILDSSQHMLEERHLHCDILNKGIQNKRKQSHTHSESNLEQLSAQSASGYFNSTQTNLRSSQQILSQSNPDFQSSTNTDLYSKSPTGSSSNSSSIHSAFQQSDRTSKESMTQNKRLQVRSNETNKHITKPSNVSHAYQDVESKSASDIHRNKTTGGIYNEADSIANHHGFGSHVNTKSERRNVSMASCMTRGGQSDASGISDFELWNEKWTIYDYIVCPNFLKGAPLDETFFERYEDEFAQHRRTHCKRTKPMARKVPRMFHRRVKKLLNKEREESRALRFSEAAAMMNSPFSFLVKIVKEMGLDITKVLESAEKLGLPSNMPCMQCIGGASPDEIAREFLLGYGHSVAGRCRRCGGELQTLASLGKMISKLRKVLEEKKLVIRDVYPDGNCMFGTVVDQLRVRGDFRYTIVGLRKAVVDYLRENPTAEDGTHFEMFLTNECWEGYLNRMSEDGQWGDHMVLSALANVLQTHIVIYGGRSGETETVISPDKYKEQSAEAETQEKNRSFPTIYLGHLGEHYVSLRPENWLHHLQETNYQVLQERQQQKSEVLDPAQNIIVPVQHIDFILRNTFQLEYISSYMSYMSEMPVHDDDHRSKFIVTLVGPIMCKMAPDFNSKSESMSIDINIFFPSDQYMAPSSCSVITAFQTPTDSVVQDRSFGRKVFDLLTELSTSGLSHLRLQPVAPDIWKDQTMQSSTGTVCLRAIDIQCFPMEGIPFCHENEQLTFHRVLAFKSEWPDVANEWIVRGRRSRCPDENVIHTVVSQGCHVVPITSNENQCNVIDGYITSEMIDSQELWSYSFAVAEIKLSSHFCNNQRCCFLLFKSLVDFTICDPPLPDALSKSVFFYACENMEEDLWKFQPGSCLVAMLQQLQNGLQMSFIPHYFISGQNLLQNAFSEHIAVWSRNIESVFRQLVVSLYFVLDGQDITATEVGALFDSILEDLPKYNCHQNILRSFNETFTPASGTLIASLIHQREFHHAMLSLEDIHEQICHISRSSIDLASVIKMLLPGMTVGYQWCFGLYIDLMKGSVVTRRLSDGYDVVHITEIFGPGIEDDMPNTATPACYCISGGDLKFPTVSADVMLQARKPKLVVKCLRYYLDTYNDIAGEDIVIGDGQSTCRRGKLRRLQYLYMTLLETYDDIGQPEQFRDLMPSLITITELQENHSSCRDLALAWSMLGETDKAKHCCTCYGRHASME